MDVSLPNITRRNLLGLMAFSPCLSMANSIAVGSVSSLENQLNVLSEIIIPGSSIENPGSAIMMRLSTGWLGLNTELVVKTLGHLDNFIGKPLFSFSLPQQQTAVEQYDKHCFSGAVDPALTNDWRMLKAALLACFYSSKVGASETLSYVPVPGKWLPDIPLSQATPAVANDWLAVWFT